MRINKILCITIGICMLMVIVSGCGNKQNTVDNPQNSSSVEVDNPSTDENNSSDNDDSSTDTGEVVNNALTNNETKPDASTSKPGNNIEFFPDVPSTAWYYSAVEYMARKGIVNGYDNGTFGPSDDITVGQFCQILANITNMDTGTGATGWWAEKAVRACLNAGYITDRGEISQETYDLPITREEATAGIFKASKLDGEGRFTPELIPDWNEIDPMYQDDILGAYNSGVTSGIDSTYAFSPKSILTRAEVCQLLYNLNWDNYAPATFSINKTYLDMHIEDSVTLEVMVKDYRYSADQIVWTSDDESVAIIDASGKVTAIGQGKTYITGKLGNTSLTCDIVVTQ